MFCIISYYLSPLQRMFHDIQIVIITNFVIVLSVAIKRVDCIIFDVISYKASERSLFCLFLIQKPK